MKKKYWIFVIMFLIAIFPGEVFAVAEYIGDNVCDDSRVRTALRVVGYFIFIAKMLVPIIIIGFGTFDLYKAVINGGSDSISKQAKTLGMRILVGILIFFVPTIVNLVLGQLTAYRAISSDITGCQTCLLDPFNCNTKSS